MPQTFAQAYDLFRNLQGQQAIPDQWTLPQFSRFANDITGTQDYQAGERGGFGGAVSKASYWLDKGIDATGLPDKTSDIGRNVFQSLGGSGDVGANVGRQFPRGVVDAASFFVPGLGEANAAARLGIAGAMSAGHAFADTGQMLPTVTAGVTPFAMGVGGHMAADAAEGLGLINPVTETLGSELNRAGNATGNLVKQKFLESFPDKAMNFAAHQFGALGTAQAMDYAQDAIQNKTWTPYDKDSLYDRVLQATVGNVPYMLGGVKDVLSSKPQPFNKPFVDRTGTQAQANPEVNTSNVSDQAAQHQLVQAEGRQNLASILARPQSPERDKAFDDAKHNLALMTGFTGQDGFSTPEATQKFFDNYNKQFGLTSDAVDKAAQIAGVAKDNPELAPDLVDAFRNVPKVTVDQVSTPADPNSEPAIELTKVHNDTQEIAKQAEVPIQPDALSVVTDHLLNAGTSPDEATIAAKVGERNDTVDRATKSVITKNERRQMRFDVQSFENEGGYVPPEADKPKGVGNSKMLEGRKNAYNKKVQQNQEDFAKVFQANLMDTPAHEDPATDALLKQSVASVKRALSKSPDSKAIYSQWGNWRDQLLDPTLRPGGGKSWGTPEKPRNPLQVLNGFLASRSARENEKAVMESQGAKPLPKSADADTALAQSKIDDLLADLQGTHDLSDEQINGLRDKIIKGGSAIDEVRSFLRDLKQGNKESALQSQEVAVPKDKHIPEGDEEQLSEEAVQRGVEGEDEDEGRTIELPDEFVGSEGQRVQGKPMEGPTVSDFFGSLLRKTGFSEPEIGVWSAWMNKIKGLFGLKGTEFGELINDSDKFQAFGLVNDDLNKVFLSMPDRSNDMDARQVGATLAHELGHIMYGMKDTAVLPQRFRDSLNNYDNFVRTNPEGAQAFLRDLVSQLPAEYRDLPIWEARLKQTDPAELWANTWSAWALNKVDGDNGRAFSLLTAPEGRSLLQRVTEYTRRVFGAIKGAIFGKPDIATSDFQNGLDAVNKAFDGLTKSVREAENNMNDLGMMGDIGSQNSWVMHTSAINDHYQAEKYGQDELRKDANIQYTAGKETGKVEDTYNFFIRNLNYIGQAIPQFRKLASLIFDHQPRTAGFWNEYVAPLIGSYNKDNGQVTARGEPYKSYKRIIDNDKLRGLASEIGQWLQQEGVSGRAMPPDGQGGYQNKVRDVLLQENPVWPPAAKNGYKLGDKFKGLDNKSQQDLMNWISAKTPEANRVMFKSTVDSEMEFRRGQMKYYLGTSDPTKFGSADILTRQLTDAVDKSLSNDPTQKWQGAQELDVVRQRIGNDNRYMRMLDMWVNAKQDAQDMWSSFDPLHMSMLRKGKYAVRALSPDGQHYSDNINDLGKEYENWKSQRATEGYTKFQEPIEASKLSLQMSPNDEMMQTIKMIQDRNVEKIKALTDLDPDARQAMLDNMNITGDLASVMNVGDISTTKKFQGLLSSGGRTATPGSMDMLDSQRLSMSIVAKLNATRRMSSHVAFELMNPELAKFPGEVKQVKQTLQNYIRPDSDLSRHLAKANAVYYLGGNLPSHMLMLSQSYITTLSEAVNRGLSPIGAAMHITNAAKDVSKFTMHLLANKVGLGKEDTLLNKIKDPQERDMFRRAANDGLFNFSHLGDLDDFTASAASDINRVARTGSNLKWYDAVKKPVNAWADFTMKAFGATAHFNERVAMLAGFRLARAQQGGQFDPNTAYDFAKDFMRNSTHGLGKANRPLAQSSLGAVGNMAYSLQTYTLGWLNQLARYVTHWKGANYLDLSPDQRTNARNAAMTQLGIQMASAGALGMPFVGAALKIWEKVTGQAATANLYSALSQQLDDDKSDGAPWSNLIMNGGANAMLAASGVPVDMGSRLAVGGVFGINPYDGFSGDSVFGPTGQVVSNVVSGLKSAVGGDLAQAGNQLAPPALRKAIALWRNGGQIQTGPGAPIPSSGVEKAAYGLGFTPQSVSKLNQYTDYRKSLDASLRVQHKQEAAGILQALQNNPADAQRLLAETSQQSGRSAQDVGKEVARTSATQTFGPDIREGLTRESAQPLMGLAHAVGAPIGNPQEVAKGTYMNNMLNMLGLRGQKINPMAEQQDETEGYTPFAFRPRKGF